MTLPSPLCAICDADACARSGWTVVDFASACLQGGARFLQIRGKQESSRWLVDTTAEVLRRAEGTGALIVVNDRADVARLTGAGGVHLGQDDLDASAVRTIVGSASCVGLSTHTEAQIQAGFLAPVDYLAIGPVFTTSTKSTGYRGIGLERVRAAGARTAARRVSSNGFTRPAVRLTGLGYAIPGTVLAIGLFIPLAGFDNWLDGAVRAAFGVSTGLLLSGTLFALTLAYVIRFLAVALGGIEAGFDRMDRQLLLALIEKYGGGPVGLDTLAAAIGETILARARLLRRGKELCFAEVAIETEDAKPIAHVTAAVRASARPRRSCPSRPATTGSRIQARWVRTSARSHSSATAASASST